MKASKFEVINARSVFGLSSGALLIIIETICIAFLIVALSNKGKVWGTIALFIFGLIIAYHIYLLVQAIRLSV
jgi:hypothetical protein